MKYRSGATLLGALLALCLGAIAFFSAINGSNGSVAEATHLAGLLVGWIYLKGPRNLRLDLNYRLSRWRMERMRGRDSSLETRIMVR